MDFVSDVADYGDAPEIFVSGFSRVTRISNGTARIALFAEREGAEGTIERRVVVYLLCDIEGIGEGHALFAKAIEAAETALPLNGKPGKRRRAGAH